MNNEMIYKSIFDALQNASIESGDISASMSDKLYGNMESINFSKSMSVSGKNADLTASVKNFRKGMSDILKEVKLSDNDSYNAESFDARSILTKSQIECGYGAFAAGWGMESITKQLNPVTPQAPSNYEVINKGGAIAQFDVKNITPSQESFDGSSKEASIYLSMVISMGASRQEDFVEAFCPTVPVKPVENGIYVTVRFPSFVNEYYMDRSNTELVEQQMRRKPIIKHIFDPEVMGQDRTLVVPSWTADGKNDSADAKAWLVPGVKFANDERGEVIQTGYYKLSTPVNIMKVSQSPIDLKRRGTNDNTDNLLPGVMMDKLLVSIQPKSATAAANIPFDLSGLNGRAFTDPQSNHNKQIAVNIIEERVAMRLGQVKDVNGTDVDFTGCTEVGSKSGYSLIFSVTIQGTGNIATGTFNVNCSQFKLVDILNDKDVSLGLDDTAIADLAKAFSTSAVGINTLGYTMVAYRANTNLRTSGQLIQADGYAFLYPVAFKSPFRVQGPVSAYTGSDGDFELINDAINAIADASNFQGVRKILAFKDRVKQEHLTGKSKAFNPTEDYNSALLRPYYSERAVDLSTIVDSLKSQDRTDDIRAALHNQIREDALKMLTESNYKMAFDRTYGQERKKITVLIGTHYHLGQYLCNKDGEGNYTNLFPLTDDIDCLVVTTMNPALIKDNGSITMLMTFSVTNKIGTIDTVQKLHPGFRPFAPVVTVTLDAIAENSAVKKITQLIPKYEHHLTMKVMQEYTISGIDKVLGKVNVNFHVN